MGVVWALLCPGLGASLHSGKVKMDVAMETFEMEVDWGGGGGGQEDIKRREDIEVIQAHGGGCHSNLLPGRSWMAAPRDWKYACFMAEAAATLL